MTADSVGSALSPDQTVLKPTPPSRFPGTHSPAERRFPQQPVSPERVLKSFNTRSFKREHPDHPELMLKIISAAIGLQQPVPFVLYWGKGPRCRFDEPDTKCLDYLATLGRRVRGAHPQGAAMTLIFTDTHAELNGHSKQAADEYFAAVETNARTRDFATCRLGDLVDAAKGATVPVDTPLPEETLRRLSQCAAKWYRGDAVPEQAALAYFRMNMVEKRAVEIAFPRSIFITFNGSEFRCLFPERLPIFYMYSLRRGVSVKPWFLPPVAVLEPAS
jgi:L-tyrosine isonitrile synthase